jgi:hypothetical protein
LIDRRRPLIAPVEQMIDTLDRCRASEGGVTLHVLHYRKPTGARLRYLNPLLLVGLRQIKTSQGMRPKVSPDREQVSHASSASAGRSRERQAKWAGPRVGASRAALATAPFLVFGRAQPCRGMT